MSQSPVTVYLPLDSVACAVGAEAVAQAMAEHAKQLDMPLHIVRNSARGMYWLEPLLEVELAGTRQAFGPVNVADVPSLLDTLFNPDKPAHPLALGPVADMAFLKNQERLIFARAGITQPLSLDDYIAHGGYAGLTRALVTSADGIVTAIHESGLRGRGGAAFPAGIKWRTVKQAQANQKYIVCNADEGDSGTFADRMLMEGDPFLLLEGMTIAGIAVGATRGFIYVRSEYPQAVNILQQAISIAHQKNWLGANIQRGAYSFDIEVRVGAGAYICGEETALLESLEGKRGIVRAKPPLPALQGLFGKPTLVHNVLTLASVPIILEKGAHYYHEYGMGRSRGTMPFQLGGNLKQTGLVEKAFGLSLRELLYDFAAGSASGRPIKAVQVGGPLGAWLPESQFDTVMDYEAFAAIDAMLGHAGIVAFDDNVDMAKMARFALHFCAAESCGKCTPCRIGSTRGVELMDRIIDNQQREANIALLNDLCDTLRHGSLCALGGLTPYPVQSALRHFAADFHADRATHAQQRIPIQDLLASHHSGTGQTS